MPIDLSNRITFHDDTETMEVDFSDLHFVTSQEVNAIYDTLEDAIAGTGQDKWFFLINYSGTRIETAAWVVHARRGKELNLTHSQGTVRFDMGEETRAEIERRANTDAFDANLFTNRDDAVARIASLPSQRRAKIVHAENLTRDGIAARISFDPATQIMDADFSDLIFKHSRDVDVVYDYLEDAIAATERQKWYFLVNYENTRIFDEAWIRFSQRGKSLNIAHSLGSVRYAPGSETEDEIRLRAESQDFRPNIRNTREEALARIEEMRDSDRQMA